MKSAKADGCNVMEYFQEVLDRSSGELIKISQGEWITLTEFAQVMKTGPRRTRAILGEMDFLVSEGVGRNTRQRLARWVTERGWGRRLHAAKGTPFDVIGPEARSWIKERWAVSVAKAGDLSPAGQLAKRQLTAFIAGRSRGDMPVQEQVCWLCDFHPDLTQIEKARIVDVSQQLVSKFEVIRRRHHQKRLARRRTLSPDHRRTITSTLFRGGYITEEYNLPETSDTTQRKCA